MKFFPSLLTFSAYTASVTTLTENSFNYCSKLNSIYLNGNSISHVPARFAGSCYAVEMLYLNQNKIKSIDEKAFEGLESLRQLSLSNNEITCLSPLLFQNTLGLSYIDLFYNNITALHPAIFKDLTLLQSINLNTNNITYIPNFDLARSGTVNMGSIMINLSENQIIAIDPKFLITLYYSRDSFSGMGPLSLYFYQSNFDAPTCIDKSNPNNQMLYSISSWNWVQTHVAFKHRTSCYGNWNAEMASNSLVTCGSAV